MTTAAARRARSHLARQAIRHEPERSPGPEVGGNVRHHPAVHDVAGLPGLGRETRT